MSVKAFISHSSRDNKFVLQLAGDLRMREGIDAWLDQWEINPGDRIPGRIEEGLSGADVFILVLSPESVNSPWVEYERQAWFIMQIDEEKRAKEESRPPTRRLIPVLYRDCQKPALLQPIHHVRISDQDYEDGFKRLVSAVLGISGKPLLKEKEAPFLVPFHPNSDFVGREEDLVKLHEMIQQGHPPVGIRPTVLVGLGGIGKTQLAVEYAYAHRNDYPGGIFWLNAVNPLVHEFAELAQTLGLLGIDVTRENAAREAWVYLDSRPDALIIFDNVVEPTELNLAFVPGLIPANLRCKTLFTTRQRDFPRGFQSFEVKVLPEMAAMQLLLRARREALEEHNPDWAVARIICKSLGWLPFALELAAAYLDTYPEVTLIGYLERLMTEGSLTTVDSTELRPEDLPTRHEVAVKATLQTQWARLTDEDSKLLFLAAGQFPEAEMIPITRLGLLTGIEVDAKPGHPAPLTRALKKLHAVSLIEELTSDRLRLHPLVQQFAKGLSNVRFRLEMAARLANSLRDILNLESQVKRRGIDSILEDIRTGLWFCAEDTKEKRLRIKLIRWFSASEHGILKQDIRRQIHTQLSELERTLGREVHNLKNWDPTTQPAYFLQQVRNRTADFGPKQLHRMAEAQLIASKKPHLLLLWRSERETQALERTLSGHNNTVFGVAVTPDGQRIVSASSDCTLRIWNLQTGREERILSGHTAPVRAVAVPPNANRIISVGDDKRLKIWDLRTGREIRDTHSYGGASAVAVTSDGRNAITASSDHTLKIWNLETGLLERSLKGHNARIYAIAITPNNCLAISGSDDRTLKIWNLKTGLEEYTLNYNTRVYAVAVTPDGRYVISSGNNARSLKVWDLKMKEETRILGEHGGTIHSIAVTPDGHRVISGSSDGTLIVWDLWSGRIVQTLTGHSDTVNAVVVTLDGRRAISASKDHTLKVWDLQRKRKMRPSIGHFNTVCALTVITNGLQALSVSADDKLKVWDMKTGQEKRTVSGHCGPIVVTPDGRKVISTLPGSKLKIWNLNTGKDEHILHGHRRSVQALAVTPDGSRAISASDDHTLKVWNLKTGQEEHTLGTQLYNTRALALTPDGRRLVSISGECKLTVRARVKASAASL